jgi:MFS family permease
MVRIRDKGSDRSASQPQRSVLFFVMAGVFLSTLDSGMVGVALPSIMEGLHLGFGETEGLVSIYLLTISATLILWAPVADRFGKGTVYLGGLGIFSCGALLSWTMGHFPLLLAARIIQGLGASMMMATGPAIIREVFARRYLGKSLGIVGIATAAGLLLGPFISGQLLARYQWNSIFLVSAMLSLFSFLVGCLAMAKRLPGPGQTARPFDWWGALLWGILVTLLVGLMKSLEMGDLGPILLRLLAMLLVLLLFLWWEKQAASPLLLTSLFGKRYFWTAILCTALSFMVLFAVLILLPLYLTTARGLSPQAIGTIMMAVPATLILFSPLSGSLYNRLGARTLCSVGLSLVVVALLGPALIKVLPLPGLVAALVLLGAGQSIFLAPNSASILSRIAADHAVMVSGLIATARNLGMACGAALAASLVSLFYFVDAGEPGGITAQEANLAAVSYSFRVSLSVLAVLALINLGISLLRD